jgi:antitoxin YefM
MANVNATQARKDFFELIKDAITKHKVFRIHHRDGDVVLMSDEEYESLQETLELLSIRGFRESIKKSLKQIERGETYSVDKVFGDMK